MVNDLLKKVRKNSKSLISNDIYSSYADTLFLLLS